MKKRVELRRRMADGSEPLSDEKRLLLILKAFKDCGVDPVGKGMVERQFFVETGRKLAK